MNDLKNIIIEENGQGLVEYSLILSLVTIAIIGAAIIFGDSVYDLYETIKVEVINAL